VQGQALGEDGLVGTGLFCNASGIRRLGLPKNHPEGTHLDLVAVPQQHRLADPAPV
jgi:hypothetical protein